MPVPLWKLTGGTPTQLWSGTEGRALGGPAVAPDGQRDAFVAQKAGRAHLHVMTADGSGTRNLTRNAAWDSRPSWSPDGRKIAFVSNRDGRLEAHVMNADGSGQRSLSLQER